ncbi:MAG: SpoIIE family protein phosphatase [Candidatus Poribacteria bacterium]|nr:SpoIIE family protein phosphatase [Candidatus Poribacteria bacterium]
MTHINSCSASFRDLQTTAKNLTLIFIVALATVFVCVETRSVEQVQTYTVADGLVGPVVPVIFQDSRGTLWFGSNQDGVSRFDGNTFEPLIGYPDTSQDLSVPDGKAGALLGETRQIIEDKWGHIWFLTRVPAETSGRVSWFDGTAVSLIGRGNWLIVDRKGDVWIGDNQRLTKYVTPGVQRPPQAQPNEIIGEDIARSATLTINVIFESKDGTIWLGGHEGTEEQTGVILSFRETRWVREVPKPSDTDQAGDETENQIPSISQGAGFKRYGMENLNAIGAIKAIAEDPDGNLWFGGYNLLFRFDGQTFEQVLPLAWGQGSTRTRTPSLTGKRTSIRSDKQGRVWFSDGRTTRWWKGSLHGNLIGFLELEDALGNLWVTDELGAHQYDSQLNLVPDSVYSELGIEGIHTIVEAVDGKLWFGHNNGTTVFDPTPVISTHAGLGTNRVRTVYEDSRGYLWFSILGGVRRYNPTTTELTTHLFRVDSAQNILSPNSQANPSSIDRSRLPRTEIEKIFEVGGDVWFIDEPSARAGSTRATYTFFRFASGKVDQVSIPIRIQVGPGGEMSGDSTDIHIIEGKDVWMAFGGHLFKADRTGLLRLTDTGFQRILFQQTGPGTVPKPINALDHGAAAITDLYKDTNERLWVHFENGKVLRYPKTIAQLKPTDRPIKPEVLPLKATMLLKAASGSKWFFNAVTGKLIIWSDTELGGPILLDGESSSAPLAVWKDPKQENNRITFLFPDVLKTYHGIALISVDDFELADVQTSLTSQEGVLWLATSQGAVQYDGKRVTKYARKEDEFLVSNVRDVMEDSRGNIWFATWGGGILRYDGETFYPLTTKNGLAHNNISKIHESSDKDLWFATEGGVTHYTPTIGGLPFCRLTALEADTTYTDLSASLTLPARGSKTFNVKGISPLREGLSYEFKLTGLDIPTWTTLSAEAFSLLKTGSGVQSKEWTDASAIGLPDQQFLRDSGVTQEFQNQNGILRIRYTGLKAGNYNFLVKAFRKGSPYTEPAAAVDFSISPPFWTRWRRYLPTLIFVTVVLSLIGRLVVNRRHTVQLRNEMREREEAEVQRIRDELNEAQNIQMGLLPTEAPDTKGFDVAGMSVPATQVGGDFYDYLTVANGQTAIAVADAAGKGLRGAMNAVLTNGMLYEVSRFKSEADIILTDLNRGLAPRMYGPSFIALNLAILDEDKKQIDYANGGQPYPVLKRGTNVFEIDNSDLPLGSMKRVEYESITFDLKEGDVLIFHSDGLIEALNTDEEMYGTERLKELVSKISDSYTAAEVIQSIVSDVQGFVGDAEQYDDMTIVVIKVPGHTDTTGNGT